MSLKFGPRRGVYIDISKESKGREKPLSEKDLAHFEAFDLIYRSLCALLFNYVPLSGHPGGSISSGRIHAALLFDTMDYDVSDPDRQDADLLSFAAGHKALGLYVLWALRNEIVRIGAPELLPDKLALQMRMEDLLGFRRNPVTKTPLFVKFKSKPLDGHPTPATPFVRLSTGASGVGVASSLGLAYGALDYFGKRAPYVHISEGEGGMTPGRVSEALAAAGTASLKNAVLHVDWNQASIDSNQVCRNGETPGDYVQWTPMELAYLHDWNVIYVPRGMDFQQILAAQRGPRGWRTASPRRSFTAPPRAGNTASKAAAPTAQAMVFAAPAFSRLWRRSWKHPPSHCPSAKTSSGAEAGKMPMSWRSAFGKRSQGFAA
jgi:transketolase